MQENRYAVLGLFVLLALAMFFYLAFRVGSLSLPGGVEVTVLFDDATGLKPGAEVKIRGVEAGKVTALAWKEGKAAVTVRLDPHVTVPRDVSARIRPETLLGENFLELVVPPESRAEPLATGDVITRTSKAIDINQFVDRMGRLVDRLEAEDFAANLGTVVQTLARNSNRLDRMIGNLDRLAVDARSLLSENRETLERTLKNLDRITASFGKSAPRTAANLDRVLARLERLTADLEETSPDLAKDLGTTLKNLAEASEQLPATLQEFQDLSTRVQGTLDHVDHFLLEDVPDLKDILEHRGIKARVRIW